MGKISKKNRLRFEKLMTEMFQRRFQITLSPGHIGVIAVKVSTKYGLLAIRGFGADNYLYNLFTCFEDPSKLPGKQVPYPFARPDTHQTYSEGGAIGGHSFNGYSGKWNFHIDGTVPADHVVQEIEDVLIIAT